MATKSAEKAVGPYRWSVTNHQDGKAVVCICWFFYFLARLWQWVGQAERKDREHCPALGKILDKAPDRRLILEVRHRPIRAADDFGPRAQRRFLTIPRHFSSLRTLGRLCRPSFFVGAALAWAASLVFSVGMRHDDFPTPA